MKIKYVCTDVEANGPIPGDYSIVSFASVIITSDFKIGPKFYRLLKPISTNCVDSALAVSGHTWEQTLEFEEPDIVMLDYVNWLKENTAPNERLVFLSDNNGFDWMFICWYLWHFIGENPMGYSSASINWLYKGYTGDFFKSFKHLRDTKHTHNPLDDATGNAEAFIKIIKLINPKFRK